jgi:hypothetical protein
MKEEEISGAIISCRILFKNKANFEFNAASYGHSRQLKRNVSCLLVFVQGKKFNAVFGYEQNKMQSKIAFH